MGEPTGRIASNDACSRCTGAEQSRKLLNLTDGGPESGFWRLATESGCGGGMPPI